jgi:hypothetical protein
VLRFVKRQFLKRRLDYGRLTWEQRALPDFIVIGLQKSGTSSLFFYLAQHPQLVGSCIKEVHFFDGGIKPGIDNFAKGEAWYRAHFPLRKDLSATQKTFEASPFYLFNPLAPSRIANLLPNVKIIALLRNPVDRAISQYFQEKRRKREPLEITEALEQEETRLKQVIERGDYNSATFIYHSYKSRGLYKQQIERYFKYFPRQQLLLIKSEDLFKDTNNILRQVFEFIGVASDFAIDNLTPRNVAKTRSPVSSEVSAYLKSYFLPHNQALYELVGRDFGW